MEGYKYLASLRTMLIARREEFKEQLARPMAEPLKRERHVGECMALEWTIEKLNEQIKQLNAGDDDAA